MCIIDINIRKDGKQLHHLSVRTLLRRIEESYKKKMKNIQDEISNAKHVCTTADVWSSHSRRFIGVTVHWVIIVEFILLINVYLRNLQSSNHYFGHIKNSNKQIFIAQKK